MKYLSEVFGKGCIVARVVAYSKSAHNNKKIITFELEYPRFIHSEFMTHRVFSRNSMSSRAVPIDRMIEQIVNNPAMPIHWGKQQKGMQALEECNSKVQYGGYFDICYGGPNTETREIAWKKAALSACFFAEKFKEAGYAKQIVNRLLEPFQVMKTVMTTTELDNFFYLRRHKDSQPEIQELANCMHEALQQIKPEVLSSGEYHTPYVEHNRNKEDKLLYIIEENDEQYVYLSLDKALKVSASCCAQVSYRLLDNSLEKAFNIYDRLVESKPVHASPFEHCGTPIKYVQFPEKLDDLGENNGITHIDVKGNVWSGNFCGWIQYRQLIKDNVCNNYV